jgi:hypothetical protein
MYWQSIMIVLCFIVSAAVILTMAFISPFFKKFLESKTGLTLNLIWLILLVVVFGATAFSTDKCLARVDGTTFACMRSVIVWTVLGLTIVMISYLIVTDIVYRVKTKNSELQTATTSVTTATTTKPVTPLASITQEPTQDITTESATKTVENAAAAAKEAEDAARKAAKEADDATRKAVQDTVDIVT